MCMRDVRVPLSQFVFAAPVICINFPNMMYFTKYIYDIIAFISMHANMMSFAACRRKKIRTHTHAYDAYTYHSFHYLILFIHENMSVLSDRLDCYVNTRKEDGESEAIAAAPRRLLIKALDVVSSSLFDPFSQWTRAKAIHVRSSRFECVASQNKWTWNSIYVRVLCHLPNHIQMLTNGDQR